jgi:UDP-3-O-[3-hydroxymyristoyl] N-acetylglucosamine deacetylase/3-hydroxyacyl-[acyl-carrier-protein] dehydratase
MSSNDQSFQHTIKEALTISGTGIHSGEFVTITIKPSAPNSGITFQRIDIEGKPTVKADVDNVVETNRSTTIECNGARVNTIEHLMAALVGMQIDNALIEINGEEVPILDGSAVEFVNAIEKAGLQEQDAAKKYFTIDHNITFVDDEKMVEMVALPFHEYRINALIDFNSQVLGTQHAALSDMSEFKAEIAPSRTFCFFHELEWLIDNHLIKGGDKDNAVVVVDKPVTEDQEAKLKEHFSDIEIPTTTGYLNNVNLRFHNEPARHKLLDVIGDLALTGFNFKAHIIANKPGHATNILFAKKIKEHIKRKKLKGDIPPYNPDKPPVFDVHQIEKILPHRYPMLMVDKVIEISDTHIIGVKNVTYNEPFFQGHFPENCIMPGVLLAEALAQCGGILVIPKDNPDDRYDTYFLKIDNCKFKQKVVPGDTLILKMELNYPPRRGICEMKGTVYVGSKIVAEADLTAQIVKRPRND